jgi:MFS family permease
VWRDPILRAFALATVCEGVAFGVYSAAILIFGTQELSMQPGLLGTIFASGGLSSLFGSLFVERISRRFGIGPVIIGEFLLFAISMYLMPMARGPLAVAVLFLMGNQP